MTPGEIPTTLLCTLSDGSCRTIDQLDAALPLTRRQISDGAASLIMRGLLERVEKGCYQLTAAGREAAARGDTITSGPHRPDSGKARKPRHSTLRQRAWNVMSSPMLKGASFTIGDIAMVAASPEDRDPEGNLQRYFHRLCQAGYLEVLPVRKRGTALTSNGFKRYRLIRNTGPIAPVWSDKRKAILDHNTGEDVACGNPS